MQNICVILDLTNLLKTGVSTEFQLLIPGNNFKINVYEVL